MATAYYETLAQEDIDFGVGTSEKRNPGGGSMTLTQVNIASLAIGQAATTGSWAPGAISSAAKVSTTLTVSGAALGDFVLASLDIDLQETQLSASVSAANTVELVITNLTGSAVTLGTATASVLVFKSR